MKRRYGLVTTIGRKTKVRFSNHIERIKSETLTFILPANNASPEGILNTTLIMKKQDPQEFCDLFNEDTSVYEKGLTLVVIMYISPIVFLFEIGSPTLFSLSCLTFDNRKQHFEYFKPVRSRLIYAAANFALMKYETSQYLYEKQIQSFIRMIQGSYKSYKIRSQHENYDKTPEFDLFEQTRILPHKKQLGFQRLLNKKRAYKNAYATFKNFNAYYSAERDSQENNTSQTITEFKTLNNYKEYADVLFDIDFIDEYLEYPEIYKTIALYIDEETLRILNNKPEYNLLAIPFKQQFLELINLYLGSVTTTEAILKNTFEELLTLNILLHKTLFSNKTSIIDYTNAIDFRDSHIKEYENTLDIL